MSDRLLLSARDTHRLLLSARDEDRLENAFARHYLLFCAKYNRVEQHINNGRDCIEPHCTALASLQLCYSEGYFKETLDDVVQCMDRIDKLCADDPRKQSCAPHVAELREIIDELRKVLMISETLREARVMKAAITSETVSDEHDYRKIMQTIDFTIRSIESCSVRELLDDPRLDNTAYALVENDLMNLYVIHKDRYAVFKQLERQFRP